MLALFPAAALRPAVERLDRLRVPRPLAALLLVVVVLAVLVGVITGLVPQRLYPLLMSRVVRLPPFLVLVSVAACLARTGAYLRERRAAAAG